MIKSIESQKLQQLKVAVGKAVQNNKTFTLIGDFTAIKEALKIRGWIEKYHKPNELYHIKYVKLLNNLITDTIPKDEILLLRLLKNCSVDLLWTMRNEPIDWGKINKETMVSRFIRADFKTKVGLCKSLQQAYWYMQDDISFVSFPRCYDVSDKDEFAEFVNDFRLTACICLITYVNESEKNGTVIFSKNGKIPISAFEFAETRCLEYIASREHEDIDNVNPKVWDHLWNQFLTSYYLLVHENGHFLYTGQDEKKSIYIKNKFLMEKLVLYWPQLHLDGTKNLWILKPAAMSRGRGILILTKLEEISSKIGLFNSKDTNKYVIQKYIERPLLIYETKFDIRQWFLITSVYPLTIWIYKESYLRFCSQIFSLKNTHESIHLSNNAVQCKYKNGQRDRNLPDENMWDCYTFQAYLRSIEKANLWEELIYPGMKANIIGTVLASQNTMDLRKNCFELFGADFMLADDYAPWLIEINSGPSMSASTSVTARLCSQVLEDVIKVVIDKKENKNADTGMFELIYKQTIQTAQPYMGKTLIVQGTKIENLPIKRRISGTKRKLNGCNKIPAKMRTCKVLKNFNKQILPLINGNEIRRSKKSIKKLSTEFNSENNNDIK